MVKKLAAIVAATALSTAVSAQERIEITPIEARATIRGPEQAYTGAAIAEVLFGATASSSLTAVEVSDEDYLAPAATE
jgi:hypothetical protein